LPNFDFYNVSYCKADKNNQIVIRGDIKNNSGRIAMRWLSA
jgi:hypothetical protein